MSSADSENAGGVHATGSAPDEPSGALDNQLDTLLKDAEQNLQAFEQIEPVTNPEPVSGDVPGPPVDEPFNLATLSAELERALRQAEAAAREEREAERQAIDVTPEAIVAVAVSATTGGGAIGPDGEVLPLIDLEALDNALAEAADAVGFGLGGDELDPPRTERIEQMSHVMEPEPVSPEVPVPAPALVAEQPMAPTPMMSHARVLANASAPAVETATDLAPAPMREGAPEPVASATVEPQAEVMPEPSPQVEAVAVQAEPEPEAYEVPAPVPVAPPAPKRAPEKPPAQVERKPGPIVGVIDGVLRAVASPLTMMSPAVRDLVGWLGLLTAFNAACVWVFVILVGPGNWPTASAQASSPASHEASSGDAHGSGGHGAKKPEAKDAHGTGHDAPAKKKEAGHGAPPKKDAGPGAPAKKKDAGHGAPAKKPSPHVPPKSKKKDSGHGGH